VSPSHFACETLRADLYHLFAGSSTLISSGTSGSVSRTTRSQRSSFPNLNLSHFSFFSARVVSINVSGHKYGLVSPGIGWALWRSKDVSPETAIFSLPSSSLSKANLWLVVISDLPSISEMLINSSFTLQYLPEELVFHVNYLGADQASFTLNFSKSAVQVIGQYAVLIRYGKAGFRAIMQNITATAGKPSSSSSLPPSPPEPPHAFPP